MYFMAESFLFICFSFIYDVYSDLEHQCCGFLYAIEHKMISIII